MSCNLVYRARNTAKEHRRKAQAAADVGEISKAKYHYGRARWWTEYADLAGCPPDPVDSEP